MNLVFPELSGQEQAEAVKQTEEEQGAREPAVGDAHYAVSNKWFTQWCQHTGFAYDPAHKRARVEPLDQPGPRPGPIDNSDLLAPPPSSSDLTAEQQAEVAHLRQHMEDRRDFWVLSEPTWNLLKDWYGCSGPEVRRQYHTAGKRVQLDAHQMHFRAMAAPGDGQGEREAVVGASALCTVGDLKDMACRALGIEETQQWTLWDYAGQKIGQSLELSLHKTLPGAKLADQQALLLAPKPAKQEATVAPAAPLPVPGALPGTPPSPTLLLPAPGPLPLGSPLHLSSPRYGACSPTSPLARSFDRAPAWAEDVVSESQGRSHGLAGLGNLGNTCFMNSSLQCLAHTPPLMQTFLSEAYRRDLNRDNPLSLGGKLALAFGALMGKLWQGGVASVSPKLFKWQLAKFAPQFSGYAQQDSQELLAFLLDGLHEDLNRITDKPYIEDKDAEGRPDAEVAAEAWTNYRRRNDSVIVDAFQGLYRSVLTCPDCNFHSVKFDPFMYLSLPLPSSKMRAITFTAVYVDGSAPPRRYGIELPRSATLGQLYSSMAELVGLSPGGTPEDRLLLTQFNLSSGDSAVYSDLKSRVSGIEDLRSGRFSIHRTAPQYVLYVYPSAAEGPRASGTRTVLVYHKTKGYSSQAYVIPATPLFVPGGSELAAELTCSEEGGGGDTLVAHPRVQAQLQALLRPCRKHPEPEEAEVAPEPAAPEAANGTSSGSPEPMDAAPPSEGPAASPAAGGGDGDAMEVEQAQQGQQEEQQQQQQQQDGQPPDAQQQEQQQEQQDGDAFDMWAPQKEDARMAAEAAAAAAASQPPYLLKLAKKSSYGSGVSTYGIKPSDVLKEDEDEPVVLLAEWQSAAEQLYDPKPLLAAEQHASAVALAERQRDGGKSVALADCLETFLQPEQLDADDCWYCSKCKKHVQADKKLDLWSLPDVLVIHLKRFSYSRYSRDKLDTLVDFPLTGLDMGPYLLPQSGSGSSGSNGQGSVAAPIYDCFAVSNHYGGMGGGHYTAYCRVPGTTAADEEGDLGHWYTFDDSHVGKMEASGVRTAAAYVLFYRRRGSCAVDVDALLAQRAAAQRSVLDVGAGPSGQQQQQHQQQTAAGPAAAAGVSADACMLDRQEALEAASQEAAAAHAQPPPPPPPLPGSIGSLGSGLLGKRQPDTIDEELEEDSKDELAPAAGGMPIDLD